MADLLSLSIPSGLWEPEVALVLKPFSGSDKGVVEKFRQDRSLEGSGFGS